MTKGGRNLQKIVTSFMNGPIVACLPLFFEVKARNRTM